MSLFFILNGWISSGQTIHTHTHIHTYTYIHAYQGIILYISTTERSRFNAKFDADFLSLVSVLLTFF